MNYNKNCMVNRYLLAIKDVVFDIVNVYAPSGDGTERTNFYTTVREYVLQNIGQNVTVTAEDDRASQVESHKHSANLLRDLVKELCLRAYTLLPTCEPYYKALYMA